VLCANLADVAGLVYTPNINNNKQTNRQAHSTHTDTHRHNKCPWDCLNQIYETLMSKVAKE